MPNNSLGGDNFGNILAFSSLYQWGWNDAIDNAVIEFNGTGPVLAFVVEDETNVAPANCFFCPDQRRLAAHGPL
jgi:hypothetical protein